MVTLWNAVDRKIHKIPVIITNPSEVRNAIKNEKISEEFLSSLPDAKWMFRQSLQINEMFVLGLDEQNFQKAIQERDSRLINKHLYRVQSISKSDYFFRHHLETIIDDSIASKEMKRFYRFKSLKSFFEENPHKVQISVLGKLIVKD